MRVSLEISQSNNKYSDHKDYFKMVYFVLPQIILLFEIFYIFTCGINKI